jgi:hypothetical protein
MAKYYFHLCDGTDVLLDADGREIDSNAIPPAALAEARAIVAADAATGHIFLDQAIEVHDAAGKIVHRLEFQDAIQVTREGVRAR